MNLYNHLAVLSNVLMSDSSTNFKLYNNIKKIPMEIQCEIFKFFIERTIKDVPNMYINKKELEMVTNPVFIEFDKSLKNTIGLARANARLEVVGNCLFNSCFQESYYDMVEIFVKQLGFTPTSAYFVKLQELFPDHKIFLM